MTNSMKKIASVYVQVLLHLGLLDMLQSWMHEFALVVFQVEVQRKILYTLCIVSPSQIVVHL